MVIAAIVAIDKLPLELRGDTAAPIGEHGPLSVCV